MSFALTVRKEDKGSVLALMWISEVDIVMGSFIFLLYRFMDKAREYRAYQLNHGVCLDCFILHRQCNMAIVMCIGDFNKILIIKGEISRAGHRTGMGWVSPNNARAECHMHDFRMIDALKGLGYDCSKFTFSNQQVGHELVRERLGHGVANKEWLTQLLRVYYSLGVLDIAISSGGLLVTSKLEIFHEG